MSLTSIIILAIVQGITEFLPISSDGHLVIVGTLLGKADLELNVVLHGGTLLSIIVFYWHRIWRLLGEDRRAIWLIGFATIPGVIAGLLAKLQCKKILEDPLIAGIGLVFTGLLLLWTARLRPHSGEYRGLSPFRSLLIGLAQAVAILPGVSRSGSTICSGMALGLSPSSATTFSFLMAIPIVAGATIYELRDFEPGSSVAPLSHLLFGAAVSFVVGLGAIAWVSRWLERGRLHLFAWWCIPLGLAVIAWQLFWK